MHAVDLLGDDVEMLGRMKWDGNPGQRTDRFGPLAGAVDHDFGLDRAAVGAHAGDRAGPLVDPDHPGLLEDSGAAVPGALSERSGDVGRVGGPVTGQPDRAEQVVGRQYRVQLPGSVGADQLAFEVVGMRGGRGALQLHEPVPGPGYRHAPAALVAGGQPGFGFQSAVQLAGVLHQPGAVLGRAQLTDQARGMPGGTTGQPALFQQNQVSPAERREVIRDAGSDDAATDYHHPRSVGQVLSHFAGSPLIASRHIGQQPLQVRAAEGRHRRVVLLHPPGPEVKVQRAG